MLSLFDFSFDSSKSTKGASKLRRDLINSEIANLRDLLPLPPSTRQRLSQLQLMALVCVYVRKANYFTQGPELEGDKPCCGRNTDLKWRQLRRYRASNLERMVEEFRLLASRICSLLLPCGPRARVFRLARFDALSIAVFKRQELAHFQTPNIGFSKALSGFLMMMTQNGKLLYISDNAAEYLGHSMEDLLIHGDSVFDIIDKQDHAAIQTELARAPTDDEERIFLCRMNVSRNARRQMRFGDQKVVLVQGHFLHLLPSLCPRQQPVFLARCTPVAMPETRECVVQGSTSVFTSIHAMDMRYLHIDTNGEFHLGFARRELLGASWYQLLHWDSLRDAQAKHRLIKDNLEHAAAAAASAQQQQSSPVIVCTNQVLSEREAAVMRNNPWLYHYYTVHSKLQFGLTAYEAHAQTQQQPQQPQSGARLPGTPLPGGLQYYSNTSNSAGQPLSGSMAQGSPHIAPPLTSSYEAPTGSYVHQTQQSNPPDSPSTQQISTGLERSHLNINSLFSLALQQQQQQQQLQGRGVMRTKWQPLASIHHLEENDNELQQQAAELHERNYLSYSENGVTLTVLRPHAVARSRKLLQDSSHYLHELSPPYSSNESSPIQKVPDVDVFSFDRPSEQAVPHSPPLPCHLQTPLTPEEPAPTGTSDSEGDEKQQ
ncbi:hypothetical protein B566_EDAN004932 [Ephemera danica]|nr:hypothetical protein B566_EDAN004932 [Ephemera danica]